jgi:arylsulfatase A-like enzyme
MPRARLPLLLATALLPACGGSIDPPTGALLISVDSLRADHLSCYGYESETAPDVLTTPVIDYLLAEQGARFENVVSTTSWTLPAHMAMLTGLPDELHGVRDQGQRLHPAVPTLAQSFQRAGWRTGGFFSGPNVHPWFGFGRGFEVYADCSSVPATDEAALEEGGDRLGVVHDASHGGVTGPTVLARFEEWFASVGEEEPFFAFVHLWDVHYDYEAPPQYDVFFPGYHGPIDSGDHTTWADHWPLSKADILRIKAMYDAEIRLTDDIVAGLLDRLRATGRLDSTAIVFTSDHGEEFLEHGRFGHQKTLYEEVVRVPLILRLPGVVPAGETSDVLASLVDVTPTLLDLCDLAVPEGLWGRSLLPALDGGSLPHRPAPLELTSRATEIRRRGWHDLAWNAGPTELDRAAAARASWAELDDAAAALPRADEAALPADLLDELIKSGYVGEDGAP